MVQIRAELLKLWTTPTIVLFSALVALPTVAGLLQVPSYTYQAPIDSFALMTNSPVSLIAPLLLTGLYVFRFSALLQHRYAFYVRQRTGTNSFLGLHLAVNVVVVGVLVLAGYLVAAATAYLVLPRTEWLQSSDGYQPLPPETVQAYSVSAGSFAQLNEAGSLVYVLGFSGFVTVFSTVIATASLCFTLLVRSRLLGLAATLVLYTAENFVLSYADLAVFRTTSAIYPGGIEQQPLWVPMVPLAAWVLLTVALVAYVRRSADRLGSLA